WRQANSDYTGEDALPHLLYLRDGGREHVVSRGLLAERDHRLAHGDVGTQPALVDRVAVGREVSRVRQPQAATFRQRDELLQRREAGRRLADQFGSLGALQRRRQNPPRAGGGGT